MSVNHQMSTASVFLESSILLHTNKHLRGFPRSDHILRYTGVWEINSVWSQKFQAHCCFSWSQWNVEQRKLAAQTNKNVKSLPGPIIARLGQKVQPLFGRNWENKGSTRSSSVELHGWHTCPASRTWWRKEKSNAFHISCKLKPWWCTPQSFLPVSWGDDIVNRRRGWVSGGAEWLTQTVGPSMSESEPVPNVELR